MIRRLSSCLRSCCPCGAARRAVTTARGSYRLFRLANGLTVILHRDTSVPVVGVNVWYHVGSANEKPGRTGFAHLFEHLMFEGSKHVKEGEFDTLLEAAGGNNNGSTTNDRTELRHRRAEERARARAVPRVGPHGLSAGHDVTRARQRQRDVVKNERRQSYENRPYGQASIELDKMLWPANHPYNWPTIGYMEDLTAGQHEDVVEFFKKYYAPEQREPVDRRRHRPRCHAEAVEKWFSEIPGGKPVEPDRAPPPQS
jgi:zinc protease